MPTELEELAGAISNEMNVGLFVNTCIIEQMEVTVETNQELTDTKFTSKEIEQMKTWPLDKIEYDFPSKDDTEHQGQFKVKNTENGESIWFSDRNPTRGELRSSVLRSTLDDSRKTSPHMSLYNALNLRLHNPSQMVGSYMGSVLFGLSSERQQNLMMEKKDKIQRAFADLSNACMDYVAEERLKGVSDKELATKIQDFINTKKQTIILSALNDKPLTRNELHQELFLRNEPSYGLYNICSEIQKSERNFCNSIKENLVKLEPKLDTNNPPLKFENRLKPYIDLSSSSVFEDLDIEQAFLDGKHNEIMLKICGKMDGYIRDQKIRDTFEDCTVNKSEFDSFCMGLGTSSQDSQELLKNSMGLSILPVQRLMRLSMLLTEMLKQADKLNEKQPNTVSPDVMKHMSDTLKEVTAFSTSVNEKKAIELTEIFGADQEVQDLLFKHGVFKMKGTEHWADTEEGRDNKHKELNKIGSEITRIIRTGRVEEIVEVLKKHNFKNANLETAQAIRKELKVTAKDCLARSEIALSTLDEKISKAREHINELQNILKRNPNLDISTVHQIAIDLMEETKNIEGFAKQVLLEQKDILTNIQIPRNTPKEYVNQKKDLTNKLGKLEKELSSIEKDRKKLEAAPTIKHIQVGLDSTIKTLEAFQKSLKDYRNSLQHPANKWFSFNIGHGNDAIISSQRKVQQALASAKSALKDVGHSKNVEEALSKMRLVDSKIEEANKELGKTDFKPRLGPTA